MRVRGPRRNLGPARIVGALRKPCRAILSDYGALEATVKDRINNLLAEGDKVLVDMPTSGIFGFIAKLDEPGQVSIETGTPGKVWEMSHARTPGRVLVSCVIALPFDEALGIVPQLVKVYDVDRKGTEKALNALQGRSEPSQPN